MRASPGEVLTRRLLLRPLREEDLAPLCEILADREAMRFTDWPSTPAGCGEQLRLWASQRASRGFAPWTALLRDGGAVVGWGGLGLDPGEPAFGVEVAYFLSRGVWGRGLATELVRAALRLGFGELSLARIGAFARPENAASLRVLEKCGFRLLGYVPELERNQYEIARDDWLDPARDVSVRRMASAEIERIGEIDRSERIVREYVQCGRELESRDVDIEVPGWSADGSGPHSVRAKIEEWRPLAERGALLGAFRGGALLGVAVYVPDLAPGTGQLAVLYVSRPERGAGIGRMLTEEAARIARTDGAHTLYVSATPTAATVDFYRGLGFEPTASPNPRLLAAEPDDVHMTRDL